MKTNLTTALCTGCGLCCNGSLFSDVELASREEASGLEVMGLDIEDGDGKEVGVLLQPCRALKGKRCSIYPYRPNCCRTFECRLLQRVKRGLISLDQAKAQVTEALLRIEQLEKLLTQVTQRGEGLPLRERAMVLLEEVDANPAMKRKRTELQKALAAVEKLIQKVFLGPLRLVSQDRRLEVPAERTPILKG